MNANGRINTSLDDLTAELTEAAYNVALQHEKPDSWIDLEMDLWHAMSAAVQRWVPQAAGQPNAVSRRIPVEGQSRYVSC
jgi:hypothetical protein